MINGQLELSLANAHRCHPLSRRQRHLSRARWWFERMRQVVDRAVERTPAPPARPEQTWLPNAFRQALPAPASQEATAAHKPGGQDRQLCE
jgi:hypothetical protein